MIISLIVALDAQGAIGKDQKLPWRLPDDLKWFKEKTLHHVVVMGRKTFETLPTGPLKQRENWVLTRHPSTLCPAGVTQFDDLKGLFKAAQDQHLSELMIIGGGEIYALFLPYSSRLYVTHVDTRLDRADTFFPSVDWARFSLLASRPVVQDERHAFSFTCNEYVGRPEKDWKRLLNA